MRLLHWLQLLALFLCMNVQAELQQTPTTIYMVGDSTMSNKSHPDRNPERGWGQVLHEFVPDEVVVSNHASGGRSTRSFVAEGRWDRVIEALQPGDWVIIQFGHNDQKKKKPHLYTDPKTDYRDFLTKFVTEAREKGAQPILATPIYRRYFRDGKAKNSLGQYPQATREVAEALEVPMVDLNMLTGELLNQYGEEDSKALFLHFEPGENEYFPNGKRDNSHLSEAGARAVASLFVQRVIDLHLGFPVHEGEVEK